ncbi:MAG: hypothetical protein EOS81_32550, partial [Mesorhizobium sp.]
ASLVEAARGREGVEVVAVGRPGLDLARPDTVLAALEAARPDIVVSAAAYTAVDQAEDDKDLALASGDGKPHVVTFLLSAAIPAGLPATGLFWLFAAAPWPSRSPA